MGAIAELAALIAFGVLPPLLALLAVELEPQPAPAPRGVTFSVYGVPVRELPPGFADELLRTGRIISQDVTDEWSEI